MIAEVELLQTLWSGYGEILRCELEGTELESVIVKHVQLPTKKHHPRNWNTDLSHKRKLKSYKVEMAWYDSWGQLTNEHCRIPKCLGLGTHGDEVLIVLEDLDLAGFPERKQSVTWQECQLCLSWLANFHAVYLHRKPEKLWENGTYWHLDTRPDELEALDDHSLRKAAAAIDLNLKKSSYQTIVHGDAKLANFCFSKSGDKVAAVDFQYVGGGSGMKDLVYFVGSCFNAQECEQLENDILAYYFEVLKKALVHENKVSDFLALEEDWRKLYPIAWADFHRFLKGWSPGHWKINSYSETMTTQVIRELENQ